MKINRNNLTQKKATYPGAGKRTEQYGISLYRLIFISEGTACTDIAFGIKLVILLNISDWMKSSVTQMGCRWAFGRKGYGKHFMDGKPELLHVLPTNCWKTNSKSIMQLSSHHAVMTYTLFLLTV